MTKKFVEKHCISFLVKILHSTETSNLSSVQILQIYNTKLTAAIYLRLVTTFFISELYITRLLFYKGKKSSIINGFLALSKQPIKYIQNRFLVTLIFEVTYSFKIFSHLDTFHGQSWTKINLDRLALENKPRMS